MAGNRQNISKSVARAFRVLEHFQVSGQPESAADLGRALEIPQPSMRVLLRNLTDLGYLEMNPESRRYFPTMRVAQLGDWLSDSLLADGPAGRLVDELAGSLGETVSLCGQKALHLEVLHSCIADHPVAVRLRPGIGEMLWRSAAGRTLLSLLPAPDADKMLEAMVRQTANRKLRTEIRRLVPLIQRIRKDGYYAGYDIFIEGVGAVCVPMRLHGRDLVLAVAGLRERLKPREARILRALRSSLRRIAAPDQE